MIRFAASWQATHCGVDRIAPCHHPHHHSVHCFPHPFYSFALLSFNRRYRRDHSLRSLPLLLCSPSPCAGDDRYHFLQKVVLSVRLLLRHRLAFIFIASTLSFAVVCIVVLWRLVTFFVARSFRNATTVVTSPSIGSSNATL